MLRSSDLLDRTWYLRTHPDVVASGMGPALQFLRVGVREGRKAELHVDDDASLAQYPDGAGSGMHPLLHDLQLGRSEGREHRAASPTFMLEVRLPANRRAAWT